MDVQEPLSGQRYLSARGRSACFPLARGFGCEARMTIDAVQAGLRVVELALPLRHRATGRDLAGFAHRGRQLAELVLAAGPLATNARGNRLPLLGVVVALAGLSAPRRTALTVLAVAAAGLADDLWSGTERGWRSHLEVGRTTGVLKLVVIPAAGLVATGSVGGALLVALAANAIEPARHAARPRSEGVPSGCAVAPAKRSNPVRGGGRPALSLRSPRADDAR